MSPSAEGYREWVIHYYERPGLQRLRIWTPPDGPPGAPPHLGPPCVCIEWSGPHVGHPGTYALLGGRLAPGPVAHDLAATREGPGFDASIGADRVAFGMTERRAWDAISEAAPNLSVCITAFGLQSSSGSAFRCVATFLTALLERGVPTDEATVLELWQVASARAWNRTARA